MDGLIGRVQRILLAPGAEWPVIAAEADTTAGIYRNYILVLAALGPLAMFVKSTLIGYQVAFLGSYRVDFFDGLVALLVGYGLSLIAVYVFALIINALAPGFGGQKDPLLALKSASYAMTAAWIAGIGQILPIIGALVMIAGAAYSIYLLYLALPVTMKTPPDKAVACTAVSVIAAMLLFWLVAAIAGSLMGRAPWMGGYGGWLGSLDARQQGGVPDSTALGFEVSEVQATCSDGAGRTLRPELNDTGGVKGLLALASWAGDSRSRSPERCPAWRN